MSTARPAPSPHIIDLDDMLAFIEDEGAHWKLYTFAGGWRTALKPTWWRSAESLRCRGN